MYEPDDKMILLIKDNYNILQTLSAFGISLGFGDKSVRDVCETQNVDTYTFLAVVNFAINGYRDYDDADRLSIPTLIKYLKASHEYFLDFQLPFMRKALVAALDEQDNLARLIIKLYDEYAHSIRSHMKYEEKMVFPYVDSLLNNKAQNNYDIETFSKHHGQTDVKLRELKNIIIKYYTPAEGASSDLLCNVLFSIYNCEADLRAHCEMEDVLFFPAVQHLEERIANKTYLPNNEDDANALSEREREIIAYIVKGLTNKEIAAHLFLSINTILTHRKNISRKLDIHSVSGLTIYAIVNGIVKIDEVKMQ